MHQNPQGLQTILVQKHLIAAKKKKNENQSEAINTNPYITTQIVLIQVRIKFPTAQKIDIPNFPI